MISVRRKKYCTHFTNRSDQSVLFSENGRRQKERIYKKKLVPDLIEKRYNVSHKEDSHILVVQNMVVIQAFLWMKNLRNVFFMLFFRKCRSSTK